MRLPRVRFTVRRMMLVSMGLGLCLSLYGWLTVEVPIGELLIATALGQDTEYADGFSERRFKTIREGMTRDEVVAVLGQPLARRDFERSRPNGGSNWIDEIWHFSRSRSGAGKSGGWKNFWSRSIFFDRARVSQVYREFHRR